MKVDYFEWFRVGLGYFFGFGLGLFAGRVPKGAIEG